MSKNKEPIDTKNRKNKIRDKIDFSTEDDRMKAKVDRKLSEGNIDFNESVFSVLRDKADTFDWLVFETRIR